MINSPEWPIVLVLLLITLLSSFASSMVRRIFSCAARFPETRQRGDGEQSLD
jgi:hypothetical protein